MSEIRKDVCYFQVDTVVPILLCTSLTSYSWIPWLEWGNVPYLAYPCQTHEPYSLMHDRQPEKTVPKSAVTSIPTCYINTATHRIVASSSFTNAQPTRKMKHNFDFISHLKVFCLFTGILCTSRGKLNLMKMRSIPQGIVYTFWGESVSKIPQTAIVPARNIT